MTNNVVPTTLSNVAIIQADTPKATRAETDVQLVASWIESAKSVHTQRMYRRVAGEFLQQLDRRRLTLRSLYLEDAREIVREMVERLPARSSQVAIASVVRALLTHAHRTGYLPYNIGALLRGVADTGGARRLAQRILTEADVMLLFRAAGSPRDRLMLRVAYYGGLRVSELVSITWGQLVLRERGQVQIASLVGKGDKVREVLLPASVGADLMAARVDADPDTRVFPVTTRRVNALLKEVSAAAGLSSKISPHWLRHAHASHSLARGASVALVSECLGHASVATTSVYLHARPGESSGSYLEDLK